ncbi:MAG: hypothetical protein HFF44_05440 [Lawsonibacter sp.]|nr:hypothetical protein [Lawsonibacter sp.]
MKKEKVTLMLFGGISPLIGALIFLLQTQINPHGLYQYIAVQSTITIIFLAYFFLCACLFASKHYKKTNINYFFAIPILFLIVNLTVPEIQGNIALAVVLSGLSAPFHFILPFLYFPADKFFLIPNSFPLIVCWIIFKMGEKAGIRFQKGELK